MTNYASDNSMMKIQLSNSDQFQDAWNLLSQDKICNLYQLDLLKNKDLSRFYEWTAVYESEKMIAVSVSKARMFPGFPAQMSVPYGDPHGCMLLGMWEKERGGTLNIFAEQKSSEAFYEGSGSPKASINTTEILFYADFMPEEGTFLPLRLAKIDEWEALLGMAAQMQQEDLGFNPLEKNPAAFQVAFQTRIKEERVLVGDVKGKVGFMVEIGTRCEMGAQVGSTFVPDSFRGQGLGVLGMRGCLKFLISRSSFVSLLCRESNIPAMKTYRRAGFTEGVCFRMISMMSA